MADGCPSDIHSGDATTSTVYPLIARWLFSFRNCGRQHTGGGLFFPVIGPATFSVFPAHTFPHVLCSVFSKRLPATKPPTVIDREGESENWSDQGREFNSQSWHHYPTRVSNHHGALGAQSPSVGRPLRARIDTFLAAATTCATYIPVSQVIIETPIHFFPASSPMETRQLCKKFPCG